ncbi:MAG: ATP-dependent zinc metalloprotease FtsH [Nitrosarchaeum sp.]|nr:ATP-dependent zinc metalloprotease FtsH [Nitrosarchaeum sp.]
MKNILKYILIIFVALLIVSGVSSFAQNTKNKNPEDISVTKLIEEINNDKVKSIIVKGTQVDIILKDGEKTQQLKNASGSSFPEVLSNLGADPAKLAVTEFSFEEESGTALFFRGLLEFIIPFLLIGVILWFFFRQAQKGANSAFSFGKTKAKLASGTEGRKKVFFKDVAGMEEVKEEVAEIVQFLKDPRKFQKLGARIPRGVLLIGSPGTGKTLLAKAVANEANVPFHFVSGAEFVEMFVGVGATRVRDTFDTAKKTSPAIIFIDEIDAVGRHRGAGMGGGHDEREQTLNQILVEMDGFDTNDAVIVLAATNRPDILDPALLRPGRFDRRIMLSSPSIDDREAILKIHSQGKPLAANVNLRVVAERTPGYAGADLANILNEAAILAARKDQTEITQDNVIKAIEKVMMGPEKKSHAFNKKEKEIAAFHEAGHALVAVSLPNMDPVHKVSIISRGLAGGYTLKLPSEDKHLRSKGEFESELAVLLGGYSAEQIIYKDVTTGASNDLEKASAMAREMITRYGMSDKLGPVVLGDQNQEVFLGRDMGHIKNYSDEIAYEIDLEVRDFINKGLKKAQEIIKKNIDKLNLISKVLIEKEVLEQDEFYSLLGMKSPINSTT